MKITERLIERYNANRPVHLQLLKKLLQRVPVVNISTDKSKYLEELNFTAANSDYGGRVYSLSTVARDKDNQSSNTNINVNIDDQLHNYDQKVIENLRQTIDKQSENLDKLTQRIDALEKAKGE